MADITSRDLAHWRIAGEAGRVLSQSRLGQTLFSLPATDEDAVTF